MENILSIFQKKENVFVREEFVFKHNFVRYYIRYPQKRTEFWAYSEREENQVYCLGILHGNEIILAKNFRTFPYDVQKGGSKLFRVYLHNDWRDL